VRTAAPPRPAPARTPAPARRARHARHATPPPARTPAPLPAKREAAVATLADERAAVAGAAVIGVRAASPTAAATPAVPGGTDLTPYLIAAALAAMIASCGRALQRELVRG
jgi:hypothetical protein